MAGTRKQFRARLLKRKSPTDFTLDEKGFARLVGLKDQEMNLQVARYLDQGIDSWVWRCLAEVQEFLLSETVSPATALHYWRSGLAKLFEYLPTHRPGLELSALQPSDVTDFVAWLRVYPSFEASSSSACSAYGNVKSVLMALQDIGDIAFEGELFPVNPFPGSNKSINGAQPLSEREQGELELAVRKDVVALHRSEGGIWTSEALVAHLLAFALRVGPNTSPLLELPQAELKEHPWVPNMKVLRFVKRRGNSTFIKNLRYTVTVTSYKGVRPEAGAIYEIILKNARGLNAEASIKDKGLLFLYRSTSRRWYGRVQALDPTSLKNGIEGFVERHQLKSDSGEPLKLNLSRLRKTRGANLWELSQNQDATANEMNNSPVVLNRNYHAVTEKMTLNAAVAVEGLIASMRAGETGGRLSKKTPVSRCGDSLSGGHAPKDGSECVDFETCLTCDSFVLVESFEDLHRFFSFYWTLVNRSSTHPSVGERSRLSTLVEAVDSFVERELDGDLAKKAKAAAQSNPHRFWRIYGERSTSPLPKH